MARPVQLLIDLNMRANNSKHECPATFGLPQKRNIAA
jgi:hypothetical protein